MSVKRSLATIAGIMALNVELPAQNRTDVGNDDSCSLIQKEDSDDYIRKTLVTMFGDRKMADELMSRGLLSGVVEHMYRLYELPLIKYGIKILERDEIIRYEINGEVKKSYSGTLRNGKDLIYHRGVFGNEYAYLSASSDGFIVISPRKSHPINICAPKSSWDDPSVVFVTTDLSQIKNPKEREIVGYTYDIINECLRQIYLFPNSEVPPPERAADFVGKHWNFPFLLDGNGQNKELTENTIQRAGPYSKRCSAKAQKKCTKLPAMLMVNKYGELPSGKEAIYKQIGIPTHYSEFSEIYQPRVATLPTCSNKAILLCVIDPDGTEGLPMFSYAYKLADTVSYEKMWAANTNKKSKVTLQGQVTQFDLFFRKTMLDQVSDSLKKFILKSRISDANAKGALNDLKRMISFYQNKTPFEECISNHEMRGSLFGNPNVLGILAKGSQKRVAQAAPQRRTDEERQKN